MDEDRNSPVSHYRGHIRGTAEQRWLNSDKWIWLPFHCRRKSNSLCSMPKKKKLIFLLAPEVDTHGPLVPQKLCYNNAPPFRTAHWRRLAYGIQLGQNIQKIRPHATPHDLGRIKPLTLGINFWNWIYVALPFGPHCSPHRCLSKHHRLVIPLMWTWALAVHCGTTEFMIGLCYFLDYSKMLCFKGQDRESWYQTIRHVYWNGTSIIEELFAQAAVVKT